MRSVKSHHGPRFSADDIVDIVVNVVAAVCRESREQVEETLDRWRYALGRGLKIIRDKTEYKNVYIRKQMNKYVHVMKERAV